VTQLVISRATRTGKLLVGSATRVLIIALLILIAVGWWLEPKLFLTLQNLYVISGAASVPLLITVAASVALLAGVIDLSVGSMTGFGAAVFAICIGHGISPFAAAAVALICAAAVGAFNASACVFFGANPLIVTLGTLTALQGLTLILLNNTSRS
jgi:ribose/xylose/arabinose/galactoside ABC-type transport system permease subunit